MQPNQKKKEEKREKETNKLENWIIILSKYTATTIANLTFFAIIIIVKIPLFEQKKKCKFGCLVLPVKLLLETPITALTCLINEVNRLWLF